MSRHKWINYILKNITLDTFNEEYIEKKHLILQDRPKDYYQQILTIEDLDIAFRTQNLPDYSLKMAKDGDVLPNSELYTFLSNKKEPTLDRDKLFSLLNQGYSLFITYAHNYLPKLNNVVEQLKAELYADIWANIYITPKSAQAFSPHYDGHDVLVLQVEGQKLWKLYDSDNYLPCTNPKKDSDINFSEKPFQSMVLEAGDFLYLPRGVVHEASTHSDISIHITLGMERWKGRDLMKELAKKTTELPFFREHIPLPKEDNAAYNRQFKEELKQFIDEIDINLLANELFKAFVKQKLKPRRENQLIDILKAKEITVDTMIVKKSGVLHYFTMENHFCYINYNGRRASYPKFFKATLMQLLTKKPVMIGNIKSFINEADIIKLVTKLIEEGLVQIHLDEELV